MRRLVSEKGELREDDPQHSGEDELEPRVTEHDEADSDGAQCGDEGGEHPDVEAATALQQSGIADRAQKR